jgi:hypothetical protein
MTRTVHPHEIFVSACIFAVLAAGLFGGGYCLGHSGQANYNEVRDELEQSYGREAAEVRLRYEETLSVNVDCRGDESDWAAIRMANEIGFEHDLPVFVHGSCLTHEVVDISTAGPITSIEDNAGHGPLTPHPVPCPKEFEGLAQNCSEVTFDGGKMLGTEGYITNVPQPEGQ